MKRTTLAILGAALLSSAALAQNPAGNWVGRVDMKFPPTPANATPQQKAMMKQMVSQVQAIRFKLTMKPNGTYVIATAPMKVGATTQPAQTSTGTWKRTGNVITMTTKDARTPPEMRTQTGTLTKGGRAMTLIPKRPANMPASAPNFKLIFTKA